MPSLESTPREIRDMIYQLSLCVEEVLVPYPGVVGCACSLKAVKPTVTLLALNKKIRGEALPILFSQNTWKFTGEDAVLSESGAASVTASDRHESMDTLWRRYGHHIRRVDIEYTYLTPSAAAIRRTFLSICDSWKINKPEDQEKQVEAFHKDMVQELQRQWDTIGEALNGCPAITSLHMDLTGLYCPMMCCRTDLIDDLFAHYMPAVKAEVDVAVRGRMDDTQYDMVIAWRTRGLAEEERAMALARMTKVTKGIVCYCCL